MKNLFGPNLLVPPGPKLLVPPGRGTKRPFLGNRFVIQCQTLGRCMAQCAGALPTSVRFVRSPRRCEQLCEKLCLIFLCMLALQVGCTTRAKDAADQQQRAIDTLKGRPWLDSEKMAYKPPNVSNEFDSPVRVNGWEAPPPKPKAAPAPGRTWGTGWSLGFFDGGFAVIVWVILGASLLFLAAVLAGFSMKSWSRSKRLSKQVNAITIDPTRVVDLPFEAQVEMNDPLEAARRMASAGDYDGAVQFLYGYMLLALDRAGQIVLHRGKTNRMYMFELSGSRPLRDLLQPAMLAFEDVFFGRHVIDRERFTQLWNNLDRFHQELHPVMQGRELATEVAPA